MATIAKILESLETIAPLQLAESWDNVGLLMGDTQADTKTILTCLTITKDVVEEAIREQVGLIVTHHPMMFKPVQRINTENEEGRLLWQLAQHGIAVYSAHTAYDNAPGGINDQLAELLGMEQVQTLIPASASHHYKIVVFVPEKDLHAVSTALFTSGTGVIGNYEQCSYRVTGVGTFSGNSQSKPTIGQAGRREEVTEYRLEVVCPSEKLNAALKAMRSAHSYEEPAFDVYPLHPVGKSASGASRIGTLSRPLSPEKFAHRVSSVLKTSVTLTGDRSRKTVSRVAITCGAGGSHLNEAIRHGADAFLTGEMRFHDELAAQAAGITVVVAGHYATERHGMEMLAVILQKHLPDCRIWASCAEQNPAQWIPMQAKSSSG